MILHAELNEQIEQRYAGRLAARPVLMQDAVSLTFDNALVAELRYANPEEYSIRWRWNGVWLGIDTAPLHHQVATFPNHFHDANGAVRADPLTVPGREPWENVRAVLDAILENPPLE